MRVVEFLNLHQCDLIGILDIESSCYFLLYVTSLSFNLNSLPFSGMYAYMYFVSVSPKL